MAKTTISDVVIPSNFEQYIWEATAVSSAFFNSGIIVNVDLDMPDGGREVTMPFWQDIGSTEEDLSDSGSLTPVAITSDNQLARMMYMGKAFSVNDLAKWIAGSDPVQNIADRLGSFWGRVLNFRLMSALTGFFGAAGMAGHVLDISAELAALAVIDGSKFADALDLMGENKAQLTHVAMHSAVHTKLAKDGLIATERDKDNNYDFDTFGGRAVVMDDSLPTAAGVYTSYLFGAGSVGFARGDTGSAAFETDRDILAGDVTATSRARVVLHPAGAKFLSASVAGAGPTRTELENAANWDVATEVDNVPIVQFKHRIVAV